MDPSPSALDDTREMALDDTREMALDDTKKLNSIKAIETGGGV